MKPWKCGYTLCSCLALGFVWKSIVFAGAFEYRLRDQRTAPETWNTVVGFIQLHTVGEGETLLDIARLYGLGFNEIQLHHPRTDPWIPEPGGDLAIPTQWVLPATRHQGIVINLPEMRLYRFFPKINAVRTYPIGIGDQASKTPEGTGWVVDRSVDPTWVVPASLKEKYDVPMIRPGPENPLGKYWLGLSRKGYGIHGTNFAWCVGRSVSNGCIRLYPEHIEALPGNPYGDLGGDHLRTREGRVPAGAGLRRGPPRPIRKVRPHGRVRHSTTAGIRGPGLCFHRTASGSPGRVQRSSCRRGIPTRPRGAREPSGLE